MSVRKEIMVYNFNVLVEVCKDALDFSKNNFLSFAHWHEGRERQTNWWQMVTRDEKGAKITVIAVTNFLNGPSIFCMYI